MRTIYLPQKHLRKPILEFGKYLRGFKFDLARQQKTDALIYKSMPSYEKEINRRKDNLFQKFRRLLGVINIRIIITGRDLVFTYGSLLVCNKPYCVYVENGLAFFNYDLKLAKNPIAILIFNLVASRRNCRKLIFMSETALKAFKSNVYLFTFFRNNIEKKCCVCYPIVKQKRNIPKNPKERIKLLYVGLYYLKGGVEVVNVFKRLNKKYKNVTLTLITPFQSIKKDDLGKLKEIEGVKMINAVLGETEMSQMYLSHDILVIPTFRDSLGLVFIEGLAHGLPILTNDQMATKEMVVDKFNGYLYLKHPLKDYEQETYRSLGKYYNPKDFYYDLFKLRSENKMKPIEDFYYKRLKKLIENPVLIKSFSNNSIALYNERFSAQKLSSKIEGIFSEALNLK